ncbi:photosystem II core complex proteins psbY, chloroplastic [Mercurialis annua]|uniref:photosystem II core complex proteins psbY, chloroplastic n=1 Tax=Mercurialis annua TaxID=3986 RepID=UPI00215FBB72|nr:photosystem II core complex proteins psbY, chloroplastic [Mercurialis annua]
MRSKNLTISNIWIREKSSNIIPLDLIHFTIFLSYQFLKLSLTIQENQALNKSTIKKNMAATMATMAILNTKCLTNRNINNKQSPPTKPVSLAPLIKPLKLDQTQVLTGTAMAGAIFSTLSSCDPAFAAQQLADIAEGDNRGLALLLPLIPAIAWVLYNILQPALNQINKMRQTKGVIVGLGLGGLAATGMMAAAPEASAVEQIAVVGEAVSDNRGQLLLIVVTPAILWVLYNILQPALNQINKMRSG